MQIGASGAACMHILSIVPRVDGQARCKMEIRKEVERERENRWKKGLRKKLQFVLTGLFGSRYDSAFFSHCPIPSPVASLLSLETRSYVND